MYRQIPANLSSLYEREKRDLLPRVRIKRNATTMILHARVQSRHGGRIDTEDITSPARMQEFFIRICQGCSREQRARLGWKPRFAGGIVWKGVTKKRKKMKKKEKRFRDAAATNLHTAVIQVSVGGRIRGEPGAARAFCGIDYSLLSRCTSRVKSAPLTVSTSTPSHPDLTSPSSLAPLLPSISFLRSFFLSSTLCSVSPSLPPSPPFRRTPRWHISFSLARWFTCVSKASEYRRTIVSILKRYRWSLVSDFILYFTR